ncbi:hypothetical protein [Xanthomonas hortorum]|uniref:hypothetical protein n=1 Tax=Xanthomonas hortorum TaxID=56454 RepID=UPI0021479475|nr:hypothetical protein [Xanthomonas hortorum]
MGDAPRGPASFIMADCCFEGIALRHSATRLMRAPLLAAMALLAACSTTNTTNTLLPPSADTTGNTSYCIGRLAVTGNMPLHFLGSSAQFYWGDVDTYREDAASYAQRLLAAQASASDGRVRQLVKPVEMLAQDDGRVIVAREEEALPLDPNVVQVTGFVHRDGTTFRFQKSAISRLQDITERRTKEILASITSSASPFPPAAQPQQGFCVMHGTVNLAPGARLARSIDGRGRIHPAGKALPFQSAFALPALAVVERTGSDKPARPAAGTGGRHTGFPPGADQ